MTTTYNSLFHIKSTADKTTQAEFLCYIVFYLQQYCINVEFLDTNQQSFIPWLIYTIAAHILQCDTTYFTVITTYLHINNMPNVTSLEKQPWMMSRNLPLKKS